MTSKAKEITHGRVPLGRPSPARRALVDVPLGKEGAPLSDQGERTGNQERTPAGDDGRDADQVAGVALDAAELRPLSRVSPLVSTLEEVHHSAGRGH